MVRNSHISEDSFLNNLGSERCLDLSTLNKIFSLALSSSVSRNSMDYKDNPVHMYPIPAKELIFIDFLGEFPDSNREVLLYDFSGKLILTKKIEKGLKSAIISLSDYTNGAYIAVIKTDNLIYNKIIIKE